MEAPVPADRMMSGSAGSTPAGLAATGSPSSGSVPGHDVTHRPESPPRRLSLRILLAKLRFGLRARTTGVDSEK